MCQKSEHRKIRFPSCRFFLAGPGPQDVLQRPPHDWNPITTARFIWWFLRTEGITPLRGQILRVAAIYRTSFYLQELYGTYVLHDNNCMFVVWKLVTRYVYRVSLRFSCLKMRTVLIWVSLRFPRFPPLATIGKHQWCTQTLLYETVWPVAPAACYEVKVELRWCWWLN